MDATTVQAPGDTLGDLTALDELWSGVVLRFPNRQAVQTAAALMPRLFTEVFNPGGSARQWVVRITPGTVRVRDLRLVDDRRTLERRWWSQPLLESAAVPCQEAALEFFRDSTAAADSRRAYQEAVESGEAIPQGIVTEWSPKSRMRMVETWASMDWTPIVEGPAGTRPGMVTLTLPGDWLAVAPTGDAWVKIMERFWSRWDRSEWGEFVGVWKKEYQRRGAPHAHLYAAVPAGREFASWLAVNWTAAIFKKRWKRQAGETWEQLHARLDDSMPDGEVRRSLRAGTGIDWTEGIRAADPKRLAVYFAKRSIGHNVGEDKEYQHVVPAEWWGSSAGRFWGYKRMEKVEVEVEVERHQFVAMKRLMRSTVKARGLRVPRSMKGTRGAVLLANDGPRWLEQASRHPPVGDASNVCLEWSYVRSVGMVNLRTGEVARAGRRGGTVATRIGG